jgi:hypothetical protein
VFSLWSVRGLYSYESSRVSNEEVELVFEIGAAPVSEIDIENGAHRVGGCRIEILCCNNWLKCTINPVVNPIPRLRSLNT